MKAKRQIRFFKKVKNLRCIFCDNEFPFGELGFKIINAHGWGICRKCWKSGVQFRTA